MRNCDRPTYDPAHAERERRLDRIVAFADLQRGQHALTEYLVGRLIDELEDGAPVPATAAAAPNGPDAATLTR